MRLIIFGLSLMVAMPAVAAPPPMALPTPVPALPPVLTDPAMADRAGAIAGAVTRSLMNLPVGEVEAAIEGRPATRADRQRTVRDSMGDPNLDQRIAEQAATSGRTVQAVSQAATRAIAASLPAILGAVEAARADIERAVGNLPDPTYPRR